MCCVVHICFFMHVGVCIHAHGGQRPRSGVFPSSSSSYFWKYYFLMSLELTILAKTAWPGSTRIPPVSSTQRKGYTHQSLRPAFPWVLGIQHIPGPHIPQRALYPLSHLHHSNLNHPLSHTFQEIAKFPITNILITIYIHLNDK